MAGLLALAEGVPSPWARSARWIAVAWRRLGWRQVALAALLALLAALMAPNGGVILLFQGSRLNTLIGDLLGGRWVAIVPLVFAAMVADEAFRDGTRPVLAYGAALLLGWTAATVLDALGADVLGTWQFNSFRVKFLLAQGSLCMAVYAYWRTTQRALERIQLSEAGHIRDRQQLLAARLLALQARVEPQFLFEALSRVGELHERHPQAADAMLADLIALLRAMLPVGTARTSTVAREFALAEAWLRVQRHLGRPLEVEIAASPLTAQSGVGAMLVLPLLQEMQALPRSSTLAWRLSAELASSSADASDDAGAPRTPRLCVRLAPIVPLPEAAGVGAVTPGIERIRARRSRRSIATPPHTSSSFPSSTRPQTMPTALIVEDEPLLAAELREELARLWPELTVFEPVHDGVAALREIATERPDVLFLDIQMPGLTGLEVARLAGARSHVVFITAFDQYAVQAFEQGAVDYLLKPIETARLAQAIGRVRARLQQPPADLSALLEQLQRGPGNERLQWITVLQGRDIQFIAVDEVCYFRADNKYIAVVTPAGESLITTPLKELVARLDPTVFWQVHRGVVVNMHAVQSVRRSITGHLDLKLKSRPETLRVSAGYAHLFKHM